MVVIRPRFKKVVLGVLLGMSLVPTGVALAQDSILDTVVVTADRQQSTLRSVPASISSVGADELGVISATHVNEALARVPGTWISRGNGQESLIAIRSPVLTGAGSCGAFQMAQDGIPLRATGFCNVNELFESNTEQAGSIEVIRGPGSVLYGANALHGAINVISDPISAKPETSIGYERGPHDYNRVSVTTSKTVGDDGYRLSFNGTSDDGYKNDSGFDQQKLSMQQRHTAGNFSVTTSLQATNLNQETAGFITGHDAYKDDSLKRVNPNPESFRDAKSYRLSSRLAWQNDWGQVVITPYYRKTDMAFLQHFNPGTPLEQNGQHSFGLMTMVTGKQGELSWQAGLDAEHTNGFVIETQSVPAVGTAAVVATVPVGKHYDFAVQARLLSPYAQLKYQLTNQDDVSLGLRFENLNYDYDNRMIDGRTKDNGVACTSGGCRFNRPADRSDQFSNSTVQLGWIHDLDTGNQVYANLTNAFRAPDTNEIYRLQGSQSVADLGSEKAHSIELGLRGHIGKLDYSAALFHMNKRNVILQDSNRINISGAETRHEGIELGAAYKLAAEWTLALALTDARHTYEGTVNPSTVKLAGLDIDTAPRVMGNAQLRWRHASYSAELEWVHMGAYFADDANTLRYPGHELLNLRFHGDLTANWYYGVNVTNLLDRDYAERADFAFGVERYFVGEPRSVYVSGGYRF